MDGNGLMTEGEAAVILKIRPTTLAAWRIRKRGPRYIAISHSCVRYQLADLTDFIESCAIAPRGAKGIGPEPVLQPEIPQPHEVKPMPPP